MKKSLLLFFLLLLSKGYSQEVDPVNIVNYTMFLQDNVSAVTISVNKLTTKRKLILQTKTGPCNFQKGIVLKFSNNETITLRDHALACEELGNGTFGLSGGILLDEAQYKQLSTSGLVEFQLGSVTVPAKFQGEENIQNLISLIETKE